MCIPNRAFLKTQSIENSFLLVIFQYDSNWLVKKLLVQTVVDEYLSFFFFFTVGLINNHVRLYYFQNET